MNKVILMGRLTRNPDVRYAQRNNSQESTCIARYTLAVNRRFRREGGTGCGFHQLRSLWPSGRICRKVSETGYEDCNCRPDPDRQLHKPGRRESLYYGCCRRRTGLCREQGSGIWTGHRTKTGRTETDCRKSTTS